MLVLVFGILDQVSPASIPDYAATQARWDSDQAFVRRIERTLAAEPGTPAIFQLPYRYFPEAPSTGTSGPTTSYAGTCTATTSRWSWGAVRGRGADWQLRTLDKPMPELLDRVAAVGYSGLLFDRVAMGTDPAQVQEQISNVLMQRPIVSANGELAYWDLRGVPATYASVSAPRSREAATRDARRRADVKAQGS